MEINYELNPDDFVQFSKENAPATSSHKPMVVLYFITYLVFIFADIIYSLFFGSLKDGDVGVFLKSLGIRTLFCFASVLVVLGIIKLIVKQKSKVVLSEQHNGLFCEHRIIFNEKELIELTDVNTSRYSWKSIGEIKELENFVVVNVLLSSTYIIPKRYFSDREEIKQFVETANFYRQNAADAFQPSHFIEYEKSLE